MIFVREVYLAVTYSCFLQLLHVTAWKRQVLRPQEQPSRVGWELETKYLSFLTSPDNSEGGCTQSFRGSLWDWSHVAHRRGLLMFASCIAILPPCLPSPHPHSTSHINNMNKNPCFSASFGGGRTKTKTISDAPTFCITQNPANYSSICLSIMLIENSLHSSGASYNLQQW